MPSSQAESHLRQIFLTTPDLVWLKDVDGVYLACNPHFSRFFGSPESEIIGKTDYDFVDTELADSFRANDRAAMQTSAPSANEEWITFADDGHRALMETIKTAMLDEAGTLIGVLGISREVTEVRAAQEALREKERYLRALIDGFPFPVWLKDTDSRFLAVNREFATACEARDAAEVEGKTDLEVWPADLAQEYRADDRSVMMSGEQKTVEEEISHQGLREWFETYKAPVTDGAGHILGTVGFSRDITDRKWSEELALRYDTLLLGLSLATDRILADPTLTNEGVSGALQALGEATSADRVYIFEHTSGSDGGRGSISQRYEWSRGGVEPQIDNLDLQNVPWDDVAPRWHDEFMAGGYISGDVADFPADERATLEPQGIVSLLALPIEIDNELWGFVGFDACGLGREWDFSEVALLHSAAKSIAVAIGRMRTEAALKESEEKYRTVADFTYDWESWSAPDGAYRYVSPSCERVTGHTADEFMADPELTVKITHPEDRARVLEHFRDGVHDSHSNDLELEFRILTPDGTERWINHRCVPVYGDDGQWLGRRTCNRDITDRRAVTDELRKSEQNFRSLLESLEDMILVGSTSGRIVYSNPAVSAKLGYAPDELTTMQVLDLNPTDKRKEAETIFAAMFAGERSSCPLPLQCKSGALVPAETHVWFGTWDGADCIFGYSKDLTAQQESLQMFDRLFNGNPTPMAVSDSSGHGFTNVNEAFLNVLGYSREEVIGQTSSVVGLFIDPEGQRNLSSELARTGHVADRELQVRRKDGTILDGLFSGELIESQGKSHFLTVMVDISELKRGHAAQSALTAMLDIIGNVSSMRDSCIADHQRHVSELARAIGAEMGMPETELEGIRMAGLMLDIGNVSVPSEILSRPSVLSPTERELVKGHVLAGYEIIASAHMEGPIAEYVLQHHERCDGSGYPRGLAADELLPGSKVLAVADVVEAMMSHRPYRAALGSDAALAEIQRGAGIQYDAAATAACVTVLREKGFAFS